MRKKEFLAAIALLLCGGLSALGTVPQELTPRTEPLEGQQAYESVLGTVKQELPAQASPAAEVTSLKPAAQHNELQTSFKRLASLKQPARMSKPGKAPAIDALAGQYVMTYMSLTSTVGDGGCGGSISRVAGTDTLVLHNFWTTGIDVKATYNAADGTVTIKAQQVYTHSTYGDMWLAFCNNAGKPDYSADIVGSVSADGVLTISSWWGIYVKSGSQAGNFIIAAYNGKYQKANGTMTCDIFNEQTPDTYNVVITQPFDNQIRVLNFGNFGCEVLIDLNRKASGVIHSQVVRKYPANADFLSCSVGGYQLNESGKVQLLSPLANDIYLDTLAAGTKQTNTLTWGPWSALSRSSSASYFLGAQTNGKLQSDVPIRFPVLEVTNFKGSGTEADPYQLKTRDDFSLLSQMTEDCEDYNPNVNPNLAPQAQAFKGKYFKVMNDIDMSGTNFTPIGTSFQKRFAGVVDGGNFTIRNLSIDYQEAFAALFGMCDTTCVIKNIKLDNANILTVNNYGGSLVAWNYGAMDNCHITNSVIGVQGQVAGGLAGLIYTGMTNCSATNVQVTGLGGWCGGLVGEVHTIFTNCFADNVTVYAYPGGGTAAGGLAGMISSCQAENLHFAGTMNGYRYGAPSTGSTGILAGGITGNLSVSSLKNAYSVGTVMGRNTYCEVGGIAGRVLGSSIENAYFRGSMGSYYSRNAGGLTGRVVLYSYQGQTIPCTFKNMYAACVEELETYQYDRVNGWAETLGKIEEGGLGSAQNIYYNNQLFNKKSQNGTPLTAAQLTSGTLPQGFDATAWTAKAGQYPVLKGTENQAGAQWGASAVLFNTGNSVNSVSKNTKLTAVGATQFHLYKNGKAVKEGYASKIAGDSLIVTSFGIDTLLIANGKQNFFYALKMAPVPFAGSGTEDDPYLISSKADLISLANFANVTKQYFPGAYFLQTQDIDLELDTAFHGIATDAKDAYSRFGGIYDGGNHYIHRFKGRGLVWATPPTETTLGKPSTGSNGGSFGYQGFIGRLDIDGVLKNLRFAKDCDFSELWASCGPAVGDNFGTVKNVRNYADVVAVSCWVGGIVGMNEMEGSIIDCYNAGDVTSGYNCAGGITGRNNGTIDNCANAGNIAVKKIANFGRLYNTVGGITTNMTGAYVRNVLNVGAVSAEEGNTVGGIVANLYANGTSKGRGKNDILYAVNYGNVSSPEPITNGMVAGMNTNQTVLESTARVVAYYDDQTAMYGAYRNQNFEGMHGLTTAQMTSGTPLDSLSTDYWQFDAGKYPVLKSFADEPALQAARSMIMTLPAGVTVRDMTADATLNNGGTWSVDPATYFSISGSTLKTGAVPKVKQNATVKCTAQDFTRTIDITRNPPVPLTGEGTQASPYLINSVDDWTDLAAYIGAVHDNFAGKFLKLTADLTFTSEVPELFAADEDKLMGVLDGDGHTVDFGNNQFTTVNIYHAPIRTIGEEGELKNFTFKGAYKGTKTYCAGVTAKVYGKLTNITSEVSYTASSGSGASAFGCAYEGARIEKVVNKGVITAPSTYVGTLFSDGGRHVEFIDCGNEGTLISTFSGTAPSTSQSIGGLIGNAVSPKLTRCYNKGTFNLKKADVMYGIGGLIGYLRSYTGNTDSTVLIDCYNTANIKAGFMIGGLLANVDYSSTAKNKIVLRGCYNTGNIESVATTTSKSNGAVGGISVLTLPGLVIDNCYNTGDIINNNPKQAYSAGIAAYYKSAGTVTEPVVISNCHNTGYISNVYNFSGGIIGYVSGYTTIENCYNTGDVMAVLGAGGIAGNLGMGTSKILSCRNSGEVQVSDSRAGGIVGQCTSAGAEVTDCFNTGNITNLATTVVLNKNNYATKGYGAGGIAGEGGSTMTRCYNLGEIRGIANVGGLSGRPSKNSTKLYNCYNAGAIHAPADTAGTLIGINFSKPSPQWIPGTNVVENCYFIKVDSLMAHSTVGTGLTRYELAKQNMGEGWIGGDDYTYPYLTANNNEQARLYAAQIMPNPAHVTAAGVITGSFFSGQPEGVTWTASISNLRQDGNKWIWNGDAYKGTVTMTGTCGTLTRKVELEADKPSGIEDLDADAADVISEQWYDVNGIALTRPAERDGRIYIVVRRYADGTTRTLRVKN